MKEFKLLISTNNNISPQIIEANNNTKIGELIKIVLPEVIGNSEIHEDFEVYLKNEKNDLNKDQTVSQSLKGEDIRRPHFFIGQCRTVKVLLCYSSKQIELNLPSSMSLNRIKNKAFKQLNICDEDGADLFLWHNEKPLHEIKSILLGSLTDYPQCSVVLNLAPKKDINGFISEFEILKDHLKSSEFELLQILGKVEVLKSEESDWPFLFLKVSSKIGTDFTLRFNLKGYPRIAPTATFWDMETNSILHPSRWPKHNSRCVQIFKPGWKMDALYLPCDRSALHGHSGWATAYKETIWKESDSIVKYLNEVIDALNR